MKRTARTLVALDGQASAWCGGAVLPALESMLELVETWSPDDLAGISGANRTGTYTTLVASHHVVFELDSLQNDLDEGPGLTAMREDHTVVVDDTESEHRWSAFMSHSVDAGVRSVLSVPLTLGTTTFGALNLYSTAHRPVDAARLGQVKLLAGQAALALAQAQREHRLLTALESNRLIGKAIGLSMERFGLDDHAAFAYLIALSQKADISLPDIATHLIDQANALYAGAPLPPTGDVTVVAPRTEADPTSPDSLLLGFPMPEPPLPAVVSEA